MLPWYLELLDWAPESNAVSCWFKSRLCATKDFVKRNSQLPCLALSKFVKNANNLAVVVLGKVLTAFFHLYVADNRCCDKTVSLSCWLSVIKENHTEHKFMCLDEPTTC